MKDTLALALIRAERCKIESTRHDPASCKGQQVALICCASLLQSIFALGRGLRVPLDRSDAVALALPPD